MKSISIDEIKKALDSEAWYVRTVAYRICQGRKDIPVEWLLNGLQDDYIDVRASAYKVCQGRDDVPTEWLLKGLKDEHWHVRVAAYRACITNGVEIPLIRRIEPPEFVYKKCRNDVIVVATIPKDAQIRGKIDGKCRSSKATIVDIIGAEAAVSTWDEETTYHKGDEIEINDFDYSDAECSTGFHFFCNEELAQNY